MATPKHISVKEVSQQEFVVALGVYLKKTGKVDLPTNSDIIRLSPGHELNPYDPDWFYYRCAGILRHMYNRKSGVKGLRRLYGTKQRRGSRPSHQVLASSTHLRKACQAMEKLNLLGKSEDGGRVLTNPGRQLLHRIAAQVHKAGKKTLKVNRA